jgi:RHS repeat-associated protein
MGRQAAVSNKLGVVFLLAVLAAGSANLFGQGICTEGVSWNPLGNEGEPPELNCPPFVDLAACYPPIDQGVVWVAEPECDPETEECEINVGVSLLFPGNHLNDPSIVGFNYSFATILLKDAEGNAVGGCGSPGAAILDDKGVFSWNFASMCTYENQVFEVEARSCPCVGDLCPLCEETTTLSLDLAESPLCQNGSEPQPPMTEGSECSATPAGGAEVFGNGLTITPAQGSPPNNPALTYRAGGAGHLGLPGSDDWTETLGLYWSHEAAQRIVPDPDESHVWLITEFGSYREFSDLVGGVYGTNSPSDEFRELSWTGAGWELHDLDGTVIHFNEQGFWTQTVDRNGNATVATYADGRLTKIDFPDKRTEIFSYHANGKLAKIEELGIDGESERDWMYTWEDDLLTRIDRPDDTAWELFYNDPDLEGFMTRMDLVGSDGTSRRVERGWEFDDLGNVTGTWRGPTLTDATGDHPDLDEIGEDAVDVWSYSFDDPLQPELTTVTDPLGNVAEYEIEWIDDGKPRLTKITGDCPSCGLDPNIRFEYDPAHPLLPSAIIDGEGNRTELFYDDHGQLEMRDEAVDDMEVRRQTMWTYDPIFYSFPTLVQQVSVGEAAYRETEMAYDPDTGDLDWREIRGYESTWPLDDGHFELRTDFTYNVFGQVATIDPPGFDGTDVTSFVYDEAERGGLVPLSRTDPIIGTTTFDYDVFNRRVMVTDPNEVQTETVYDELDRVTHVIQRSATVAPGDPIVEADLVTQHCYSEFGDLFRTILPRGNVLEYGYDSAGRLTSIERKAELATTDDCDTVLGPGERTVYMLDPAGNRIAEELQRWDPGVVDWVTESETGFEYSTRCQLDKILHPEGRMTEYAYDCNGNLEQTWDANHPRGDFPSDPSQAYEYDALDRLITIEQPWAGSGGNRAITTYDYDLQDHLIRVTDAEGNVTDYEYSDRDLLTEQVSPVSGTTTYTYNPHGELFQEIDARGVVVGRVIDALDRVTMVDYPDDTLDTDYDYDTAGSCAVTFPLGRLSSITRSGRSIDYCYDRFGRVTQDGALGYAYDENGNRTRIGYPDEVTAVYTHDFADRQATLTVDDGVEPSRSIVTGSTYEPSGPLASLDLGNGLVETREFDQRYFPDSIAVSGGELDRSWLYETDFVGNIEQIRVEGICGEDLLLEGETLTGTETLETCGEIVAGNSLTIAGGADITFRAGDRIVLDNGFTVEEGAVFRAEIDPSISGDSFLTYGYQDWQYFLESATGPWGDLAWTYDKIGNRLTEERNEETDVYHYHKNTAAPPGNTPILDFIAVAGSGNRQYNYGDAGHLEEVEAGANVIDFTSDDAGRLSGIERISEHSVSHAYDGRSFLSRIEKPLGGTDVGWLEPVYSSEGLVHRLTRQESPSTPEQAFHLFYFAGRLVAQLALEDGGNPSWTFYTTDHLGTPLLATDVTGAENWSGPFEPFGEDPLKGTPDGALANDVLLRFPGQWEDSIWQEATEGVPLYYNVHRWYEHKTGRYSRTDPILKIAPVRPDIPLPFDVYLYAANNPAFYFDPLGLQLEAPTSCCQCPEQIWDYKGGSVGAGLIGGVSFFAGNFKCRSRTSLVVPVEGHCWSLGLQAFVALQGEFSLAKFFVPGARACSAADLATKTEYVSASAKLGLGAQKDLQEDTGVLSIGLAKGAGVAKQWCKIKINVPLFELLGGRF